MRGRPRAGRRSPPLTVDRTHAPNSLFFLFPRGQGAGFSLTECFQRQTKGLAGRMRCAFTLTQLDLIGVVKYPDAVGER